MQAGMMSGLMRTCGIGSKYTLHLCIMLKLTTTAMTTTGYVCNGVCELSACTCALYGCACACGNVI